MAKTYRVFDAAQLEQTLKNALGGDLILLGEGDYGNLTLTGMNYSAPLTIKSLDLGAKAHFDSLKVANSSQISLIGLDLGKALRAGEFDETTLNSISSSTGIRISDSDFHGSKDGNPQNDGVGLRISRSTDVKVASSTFSELSRGVYVLQSEAVAITGNDFHDIRTDGVDVTGTKTIRIENNIFRDFRPTSTDHADAIQFWNTGQTRGSESVIIRKNVVWMDGDYAPGAGVQGIWMADPGDFGYRDVLIDNNFVYSTNRWNGISVYSGRNVQISNNSLLSASGDAERLWVRLHNSDGVRLSKNIYEDLHVREMDAPSQVSNLNLRLSPGSIDIFPNYHTPKGVVDLVSSGIGFQPTESMLERLASLQASASASSTFGFDDRGEFVQGASEIMTVTEAAPFMDHISISLREMSLGSFVALP